MRDKIVQIIPATGWRAVYAWPDPSDPEGRWLPLVKPLLCIALIEADNGWRYVDSMQVDEDGVISREESRELLGLLGPGEELAQNSSYWAERAAKRGQELDAEDAQWQAKQKKIAETA